jgi:hypothetical protein
MVFFIFAAENKNAKKWRKYAHRHAAGSGRAVAPVITSPALVMHRTLGRDRDRGDKKWSVHEQNNSMGFVSRNPFDQLDKRCPNALTIAATVPSDGTIPTPSIRTEGTTLNRALGADPHFYPSLLRVLHLV